MTLEDVYKHINPNFFKCLLQKCVAKSDITNNTQNNNIFILPPSYSLFIISYFFKIQNTCLLF